MLTVLLASFLQARREVLTVLFLLLQAGREVLTVLLLPVPGLEERC